MKRIGLLLFAISMASIFSCTKDCCTDGEIITEEEIVDTANENESDNMSFSDINGSVQCPNNFGLEGVSLSLTNQDGMVFTATTNSDGGYQFVALTPGNYNLQCSSDLRYPYSNMEYLDLIQRLRDRILAIADLTPADLIAYDLRNYGIISTLDQVTFDRLREGIMDISEIEFPWRFIPTDKLQSGDIFISDQFPITVDSSQTLDLNITAIYIGDPLGLTCN